MLWARRREAKRGRPARLPSVESSRGRGMCRSGFLCSSSVTRRSSAYSRFVCFKNLSGSRWEGKPSLGFSPSPWAASASSSPGALGFSARCREGFLLQHNASFSQIPWAQPAPSPVPCGYCCSSNPPGELPCTLNKHGGCLRGSGALPRARTLGLGGTLLLPTPQFATR